MSTPTTLLIVSGVLSKDFRRSTHVGVDNDLTSGQTGVTLGTTNDEEARGLEVVDGAVVQELSGDGLLDDLLEELLADSLGGDILAVLGGDDDGVDTEGLDGTVVVGVFDGDLGLGVRTNPRDGSVEAALLHDAVKLVGEQKSEGEELRGLVGGISEHDTLVTSTELLKGLIVVKTLSDIRGLLLNGDQDVASLVIETLGGVVVSDVLDGTTDDLLVIESGLGGDFTEDHDHTGLGSSLASDLRCVNTGNFCVGKLSGSLTLERGSSAKQASRTASET